MSWTLRILFRDRADPLADVATAARHLGDQDESATVRELALEAMVGGDRTTGDLLDCIEAASPTERRAMLDSARAAAGLETATAVDQRRQFEAIQPPPSNAPLRDSSDRTQALCVVPDCRNFEPDPSGGGIAMTPARRWHCLEHRDQAAPGDMEPHAGPRYGYSLSGAIVDLDAQEVEAAREREREKSRQAQRTAREVEQHAAAAQAEEDRRAERERLQSEMPDPFFRAQMGDG